MSAGLSERFLEAARAALAEEGLDGWLLWELEGRNPLAVHLLGLPEEGLSRRTFVLVPRSGRPLALVHSIERQAFEGWGGRIEEYVGWEELEERLGVCLEGRDWVAMEVSERDGVPFVDSVPAGVVELVEGSGVRVVSSANLISKAYARWSETGYREHVRAGETLARTAREAFERAAGAASDGDSLREAELAGWILERLREEGLAGRGVIVAAGPNTSLPHYTPPERGSREIAGGDLLLLDLWGRTAGEPEAVFADQTWMGVLGPEPPPGVAEAWTAVREARDGAVSHIRERWEAGEPPAGAEVDRRAREILFAHGYREEVLHRTGHAMDRRNHGFGPNLDSVETRDDRPLLEGVGFSVEPGLYRRGEWGVRSEINVRMGPDGPEVTTPDVQAEPWTLPGRDGG